MQKSQLRVSDKFQQLNKIPRDRLAHIELRLRFLGEIRRPDLIERFGIQSAAASREASFRSKRTISGAKSKSSTAMAVTGLNR